MVVAKIFRRGKIKAIGTAKPVSTPDPEQANKLELARQSVEYNIWYRNFLKTIEAEKRAKSRQHLSTAIQQCK